MLDPRIKLATKMLVQVSCLTGEGVTHKKYRDESTVTVRDEHFLKPQRRHLEKSAPRRYNPDIGRKPTEKANADIVEMETNEVAPKSQDQC